MVFIQKHMPKTTYIQHFSDELKFTPLLSVKPERLLV